MLHVLSQTILVFPIIIQTQSSILYKYNKVRRVDGFVVYVVSRLVVYMSTEMWAKIVEP